ncbi:OmpA family protein [Sansalvadorimonas sp. 2012CJ34-2]|uniref:OmpA family protein n=1 Tax=Parendozoicomonas callyspongiae TaxID=2942213 RepID=A0ABT0PE87_9GAMM|nr:OmpA family protein [Sansalvadorimonas sp. 2012CJ34-2]MCL6269687.1 OmpA family protein [Sansalvadorimonas sp. 2012CJ34-2]
MTRKNNNSRLSAMALALGLTVMTALPVQAQEKPHGEWTTAKTSVMAGTSIAGALLGGPIGFVLGVAAGDWLGTSVNKAEEGERLAGERDRLMDELAQLQQQLDETQTQLVAARQETGRYQDLALDSLQLTVMFDTAGDTLNDRDKNRLDHLVRLLNEHEQISVQLTGYADPRGEESYNIQLSERRAESVKSYLIDHGIAAERVFTKGEGALKSLAKNGNYDAYAMERVVTIELREESKEQFAAK